MREGIRKSLRWRAGGLAVSVLVLTVTFGIYRASPLRPSTDAHYSLLAAEALITGHGFDVAGLLPAPSSADLPGRPPGGGEDPLPYQLHAAGDRILPYYSPAAVLLAAPLYAALRPLGFGVLGEDGRFDRSRELRTLARLAVLVTAVTVWFGFLITRRLLPPIAALAATAVFALGTPLWSTASRSLWTHDWLLLATTAALLHLLVRVQEGRPPSAVLLASLLAVAVLVRPIAVVGLVCTGVWLLAQDRRSGWRFAAAGAAWGLAGALGSLAVYGSLLPPYVRDHASAGPATPLPEALAGLLVSPSRGLLVYCPWLLAILALAWRHRGAMRPRGLAALAWTVAALTTLVTARSPSWWGGHSYGPRLLTDTLPWLLLASCLVLAAAGRRQRGRGRHLAPAVLLGALAMALHAPGALDPCTWQWNDRLGPRSDPGPALWDWRRPQCTAHWQRPPPA